MFPTQNLNSLAVTEGEGEDLVNNIHSIQYLILYHTTDI